jgi:hypothetical protein
MTHCACRSRARAGHQTVTGPVTSTCLHDRRGRAEATQTALGEALVMHRRTRVRFPPPPPRGAGEKPAPSWRKGRGHRGQRWPRPCRVCVPSVVLPLGWGGTADAGDLLPHPPSRADRPRRVRVPCSDSCRRSRPDFCPSRRLPPLLSRDVSFTLTTGNQRVREPGGPGRQRAGRRTHHSAVGAPRRRRHRRRQGPPSPM